MNFSGWSLWMRQRTPFLNEWPCEVWTLLLVKGRLEKIHCGEFVVISLLCLVACWGHSTVYIIEKIQLIEVCDLLGKTRKTSIVKQQPRSQGGKPWVKPAVSLMTWLRSGTEVFFGWRKIVPSSEGRGAVGWWWGGGVRGVMQEREVLVVWSLASNNLSIFLYFLSKV